MTKIIAGFWKKAYTYFQTIVKASVRFQMDRTKTVGGVTRTKSIPPIHSCGIRPRKESKLKMQKVTKIVSEF